MNREKAQKILSGLVGLGVRCFCLCPGGRLAPFVELLSRAEGLEVLSFFEERSAGFFALGRTERGHRPCAALCTSGTAVAQFLPSAIEAFYSGKALIFVTADRPLSQGQNGAPQTLKSASKILRDYCGTSLNIQNLEDINASKWDLSKGHLHLNVCFDTPLLDNPGGAWDPPPAFLEEGPADSALSPLGKTSTGSLSASPSPKAKGRDQGFGGFCLKAGFKVGFKSGFKDRHSFKTEKALKSFFKLSKRPLVLAGALGHAGQKLARGILKSFGGLLYTEALSGLEALPGRLISGENVLRQALKSRAIDGVIRLGALPKARFWRDLENHPDIPVLSFCPAPFYPGLARPSLFRPLEEAGGLQARLSALQEYGGDFKAWDRSMAEKLKALLKAHSQSEDFWFWRLRQSMKKGAKVFLGNSLPVRLWGNTAFCPRPDLSLAGQSGANGIDGLLSRFFGACGPERFNVGVFGDLSLLYDTSAFWRAKDLPPWTVILINNFGGGIFSRLFQNPAFLNEHRLGFAPLAKMWDLPYKLWENSHSFQWPEKPYTLVEIRPDKKETGALFQKSLSLWNDGLCSKA